ncbi:hypothetical protein DES53_103449 [Roseimicrobium gellanilyticum]|uniref:HEAT repeat domain-containing protein n=1 Tax=Roseimicrobium gellanilyticum TaxID=748857 RepID=A0A366HRP8_9BACT|nr:hypothetical protein [Roseimicrobium gellanilyticum]RBP45449.1 hypothetical protein DES53_103449 [Roseimicrobium gellanilyticum]
MNTLLRILTLSLVLFWHACGQAQIKEEGMFLDYKQSGGYMQYSHATIQILQSGDTVVRVQVGEKEFAEHKTTLSPEEIEVIRVAAHAVDFFNRPPSEKIPRLHAPDSELLITDKGRTKISKDVWDGAHEPLMLYVHRLMTQATALHMIQTEGDLYTATGAVKTSHAGTKALQPRHFRKPLMDYIRTHQDWQRVNWALQALACVITPEEYAGFVSAESRNRSDKDSLIKMQSKGWIPDTHFLALAPLYLAYVREHVDSVSALPPEKKEIYEACVAGLREARYVPAIPLMVASIQKSAEPNRTLLLYPLAYMGLPGLQAITPLLSEGDETHRLDAMELTVAASRLNPDAGYGGAVTEYEYEQMRKLFTDRVLPALRSMAEGNGSKKLKESAVKTIGTIEEEMAK